MRSISLHTDDDTGGFSPINSARRVMRMESDALKTMADQVGEDFAEAVRLLADIEGRIIVTGMGKSGHVARKIAATMASTGSPAQFVHPAEASHGDLGMITRADAVLALSNSGNTVELSDVLAHCKRISIPLIAITSKVPSHLASLASVTLQLPAAPEACPLRLAPTTSTTLAMAMGDALAVALLEKADFSSKQFQELHPGGMLGRRLMLVSNIMHKPAPLVAMDAPMTEVLVTITQKSFGCVGVADADGHLVGIITDGDLRRSMNADLLSRTAAAVMTRNPKTIRPGALAAEALAVMNEDAITSLLVADDSDGPQTAVGIVHIHDCLRAGLT